MRPPKQLQLPLFIYDHPREVNPLVRTGHGFVYAILMDSHAIKLGWTGRSPQRRARELRGELVAWCRGTLDDEAAIHERLAKWRVGRTEDFWPSRRVWEIVEIMADADVWDLAMGNASGWHRRSSMRSTFEYHDHINRHSVRTRPAPRWRPFTTRYSEQFMQRRWWEHLERMHRQRELERSNPQWRRRT